MIMAKEDMPRGKIEIDLTGPEGNAYVLMGKAKSFVKQFGGLVANEEGEVKTADDIITEMKSGDYENLLNVFEKYFGEYVIMYR